MKETKKKSVKSALKESEMIGSKVAIIINKARDKANKVLAKTGYEVNINVEFCALSDKENKESLETKT